MFASSWLARRFRVVFRVVNSVSRGETAKPRVVQGLWYAVVLERVSASFVTCGSTATCFCRYTLLLERVGASFVVYGGTGTLSCKFCSIREYGNVFVQVF